MSQRAAENTKAGILGALGGALIAFGSYWLVEMDGQITQITNPEHIDAIFSWVMTNVLGVGGYAAYNRDKPNYQQLRSELIRDEGRSNQVYLDSLGNRTVGIGGLITPDEPEHSLPVGARVSNERVDELFTEDLADAIADSYALFPDFDSYPAVAQRVITNMAFQLGRERLSRFKNTRRLIEQRKWPEAADEMLNSRWAMQTPERANRLSEMLRSVA